jgi:hypothetical protein
MALPLVCSVALCLIGITSSISGAATVHSRAASPGAAAGSVKNYKNTLARNTKGWCTYAEGCNGQTGASDYGTIDVVPASFSNDGGYAAGAPGPGKQKSYARVSGGGVDQDTIAGCAAPGSENCTGPYVLYGGTGTDSVFPTSTGFLSSIKIYLDTNWANSNPGQVVDWDVSLNDNTGAFLRDFIFNMCSTTDGGGGFYVSVSNNAGGCSTGPTEVTASGWYTLEQQFYSIGGQIVADFLLVNSSGTTVERVLQETGIATADAGGPNYGWFPDEDVLGLPVAQISLTK